MQSFETLQFYKPNCRLFAPIAATVDGISGLLETIDQQPLLIAWMFDCSPGSCMQNPNLRDEPDSGGVGMMDTGNDKSLNLDPLQTLNHGNGFCMKPDGEFAFFEFHRVQPCAIFAGLQQLFLYGERYNLSLIKPNDFETKLQPEDVVTIHGLRNSTMTERVKMAQSDVFGWLVDIRRAMSEAKMK